MCGCLSYAPYWGPGPQPRHVLWRGNQPETLWFTGWLLIHWTTPARAYFFLSFLFFFLKILFIDIFLERRKGGREISVCGCLLHGSPNQEPGLKSRHVPWPGINLRPFRFAGHSHPSQPQEIGGSRGRVCTSGMYVYKNGSFIFFFQSNYHVLCKLWRFIWNYFFIIVESLWFRASFVQSTQ